MLGILGIFYFGLCREIVAEADKDGTGQLTIQEFTSSPKVCYPYSIKINIQ
jgi:hypothetical protein